MSAAQTQFVSSTKKTPLYPFLSQPPPQKKRPIQPLPSPPSNPKANNQINAPASPRTPPMQGRRRSATTSAVTAWLANVHPGSPAPYSPRRSPSAFSRRPSLTRSIPRRPSVTSVRVSSASFLNILDTPSTNNLTITPVLRDFSASDFRDIGYTALYLHFPITPSSPEEQPRLQEAKQPKRVLKSFRSLSSLKPRRVRSQSAVPVPMPSPPPPLPTANDIPSKTRKSKYTKYRPAPLTNELALAQLMDGGKIDDHASRFAKTEAKAAGAVKVNGQLVGVGGVWRDGDGGVWRDQDEELEYTYLLASPLTGEKWVHFGSDAASSPLDGKRGSLSTADSDLSPRYAMKTEPDGNDDLAIFGGALSHTIRAKPGMSVLAIPSRSRRTVKHLRKPEFLLDVFPVPTSPTRVPKSPASPRFAMGVSVTMPPKSKTRRRPAPLTLLPPSPAFKLPTNPSDPDIIRKDFLENSFAPMPIEKSPRHVVASRIATHDPVKTLTTKPSTLQLNMKGIFRAMGGKKSAL